MTGRVIRCVAGRFPPPAGRIASSEIGYGHGWLRQVPGWLGIVLVGLLLLSLTGLTAYLLAGSEGRGKSAESLATRTAADDATSEVDLMRVPVAIAGSDPAQAPVVPVLPNPPRAPVVPVLSDLTRTPVFPVLPDPPQTAVIPALSDPPQTPVILPGSDPSQVPPAVPGETSIAMATPMSPAESVRAPSPSATIGSLSATATPTATAAKAAAPGATGRTSTATPMPSPTPAGCAARDRAVLENLYVDTAGDDRHAGQWKPVSLRAGGNDGAGGG